MESHLKRRNGLLNIIVPRIQIIGRRSELGNIGSRGLSTIHIYMGYRCYICVYCVPIKYWQVYLRGIISEFVIAVSSYSFSEREKPTRRSGFWSKQYLPRFANNIVIRIKHQYMQQQNWLANNQINIFLRCSFLSFIFRRSAECLVILTYTYLLTYCNTIYIQYIICHTYTQKCKACNRRNDVINIIVPPNLDERSGLEGGLGIYPHV